MTATTIFTDVTIMRLLACFRDEGLPAWASLRISTAPNQVWIYFDNASDVGRWVTGLPTEAEVVLEEFPAEGIHFHSATVTDAYPGWCIYLAARVERRGRQAPVPAPAWVWPS